MSRLTRSKDIGHSFLPKGQGATGTSLGTIDPLTSRWRGVGAGGQGVICVKSPSVRHRPAPPSTLLIAPHQAYSRHSHPRAETLFLLSDPALQPLYASSHDRLLLSLPAVHQLGRDEWPSVPDFCLRAQCSATAEPILFFADFVKSKEVSQKHCSGDLGVLDGRVSVTEVSPAIICLLSGLA